MAIWKHTNGRWAKVPLQNSAKGMTAFVVCHGPSFNKVDVKSLQGAGRVVIGVNSTYPSLRPDYWVGMDTADCYDQRLWSDAVPKILRGSYGDEPCLGGKMRDMPGAMFADVSEDAIGKDAFFWHNDTLMIALQFARWLGCKRICLVGVDLINRDSDYADPAIKLKPKHKAENQHLYDHQFKRVAKFTANSKALGVEVVSCAEGSRINSLMPYASASDVLDELSSALPTGRLKNHVRERPASAELNTYQLVNDCAAYHIGSQAVTKMIHKYAAKAGLSYDKNGRILVINGEGSMHHDAPRSKEIINRAGDHSGGPICLINSVWQKMTMSMEGVVIATARESLSGSEMHNSNLANEIRVLPDISLCHEHRPKYTGDGKPVVIDSVIDSVSLELAEIAQEHDAKFIRLCNWRGGLNGFIDLLAKAPFVITGRFHGATMAILAGAPFVAVESNTWKIRGMMLDLGLTKGFCGDTKILPKRLAANDFVTFDRANLQKIEQDWEKVFQEIAALK